MSALTSPGDHHALVTEVFLGRVILSGIDLRGPILSDLGNRVLPDLRGAVMHNLRGRILSDLGDRVLPDFRGADMHNLRGAVMHNLRGHILADLDDVEGNMVLRRLDKCSFQMVNMASSGNQVARSVRLEGLANPVKYQGLII